MKRARSPRKTPGQSRSRTTVAAIIEAAARIFTEFGFDDASTNTIARRAGISIGSLYQYFPNKLALLEGVRERHVTQLWAILGAACDEACAMPWPGALRHVISAGVAFNLARIDLCALFARELPVSFADDARVSSARTRQRAKLRRFLRAHRTSIRLSEDEAVFAMPTITRAIFTAILLERPERLRNGAIVDEIVAAARQHLCSLNPP